MMRSSSPRFPYPRRRSPFSMLVFFWGFFGGMLFLLVVLVLTTNAQESAFASGCVPEWGTCVMSRDCCGDDVTCVAGDWAVTTDSTCLSPRSQALDALSRDKKLELVTTFYDNLDDDDDDDNGANKKTADQIQKLLNKYSRTFSKLVSKLEHKYKIPVVSDAILVRGEEL